MDWEAIGAVGEILGAGGVIATLGYLAAQIRANTRATEASSRHEITRDYKEMVGFRLSHETMEAWREGLHDPSKLSADQRSCFANMASMEALNFQAVWAEFENGTLDEHTYQSYLDYFASVVITPGGKTWWEFSGRRIFVPNMVATVDDRIAGGNIIDLLSSLEYRREL